MTELRKETFCYRLTTTTSHAKCCTKETDWHTFIYIFNDARQVNKEHRGSFSVIFWLINSWYDQ